MGEIELLGIKEGEKDHISSKNKHEMIHANKRSIRL